MHAPPARGRRGGARVLALGAPALALVMASLGLEAPAAPTFGDLPEDVRAGIPIRLARPSTEIPSSPFATLTSFEVHGSAEDEGVIATARRLGVKHFVMHNIHRSLRDAEDPRLTRWVNLCREAGMEVRAILHSTDLDLWQAALVNWGDRIRHWSYLNEPNHPQNHDHTNPKWMPERYVAELRGVRELRDRVAPDVLLGGPEVAMLQGMEERPFPWLRLCIEAGLLEHIDFFSFHPYRQGYSPRNIPEYPSRFFGWGTPPEEYATYEEQVAELRRRVGDKPLAVTEVGWSTTPRGSICEHTQAKFALRQQIMDFALGIECAVYFLLRERHVDRPHGLWHLENHFGIVHTDNSPKPAYIALQGLYAQIDDNCRPAPDVEIEFALHDPPDELAQTPVKWYLFEDDSEPVPTRKLLFWLPVEARDDWPAVKATVRVGNVTCSDVPVNDRPRLLRVHNIEGRWGWPVLVDFMLRSVREDQPWEEA